MMEPTLLAQLGWCRCHLGLGANSLGIAFALAFVTSTRGLLRVTFPVTLSLRVSTRNLAVVAKG